MSQVPLVLKVGSHLEGQGWKQEALEPLSRLNSLGEGEDGSTGTSDSPEDEKVGSSSIGIAIGTGIGKLLSVNGMGDELLPAIRISLVRVSADNKRECESGKMKISSEVVLNVGALNAESCCPMPLESM